MRLRDFDISFSGLKEGTHYFEYNIDNKFFSLFGYQEFNDTDLNCRLTLEKRSTLMNLLIETDGTVNVDCDVSNEPFNQHINAVLKLVIKFGEEFNDEDDEILILPHGEHQFNVGQYIYESIVLSVPSKRVHPSVQDGTLKSIVLDKLQDLSIGDINLQKEDTDPRWEGLKKLLTDNRD